MNTDIIIITEYCTKAHVNPDFLWLLNDEGLIEIQQIDGENYISVDQLADIEKFVRWHDEFSINMEGIYTIYHLHERIERMRREIVDLKNQLKFFM